MLLIIVGCKPSQDTEVVQSISLKDAQSLKTSETDVLFIDVRTPEEIADGKIWEAAAEYDVKNENFKGMIENLDRKQSILVYCRSGKRSTKAAQLMEEMGFEKIYNLEGGYLGYQKSKE